MEHGEFGSKIRTVRSRRRTLAVEIDRDGNITVRAPIGMPQSTVDVFLREKSTWIRRRLEIIAERNAECDSECEPLSEDELKELCKEASEVLPVTVAYYAAIIGVSFGRIGIRLQHTRWGSCSSRGNLNFNALLMLCPTEVRDYVVIHELCHIKQMNHSAEFWAEVMRHCPNYRSHKKWLAEHGGILIRRLG